MKNSIPFSKIRLTNRISCAIMYTVVRKEVYNYVNTNSNTFTQ